MILIFNLLADCWRRLPTFQHYKICFLSVNEIENFAIRTNPAFANEPIRHDEQNYDNVKLECFYTAISNLEKCRRAYLNPQSSDNEKNLFNKRERVMLDEAKKVLLDFYQEKKFANLFHDSIQKEL